jgi:hypothetical protein
MGISFGEFFVRKKVFKKKKFFEIFWDVLANS